MTWDELSTLPPLRDTLGTILLEEVDDDTRTATFRVYGCSSLTATLTPEGAVRFDSDAPPVLRDALNPQPPSTGSDPVEGQRSMGSDPLEGRRGLWVAVGAACGVAAIAAWRRR